MAITTEQSDLLIWKAKEIARTKTSSALMKSILDYKKLANKTGIEAFLWGFFIHGAGHFYLHKAKAGLLFLGIGVGLLILFVVALSAKIWSLAGLLAILLVSNGFVSAISSGHAARPVCEEAAFLLDQLLKVQNESAKTASSREPTT